MLKSLLLLPIFAMPAGAIATSVNQQTNTIKIDYNTNREIKVFARISASVKMSTYGRPGYRHKESDNLTIVAWNEFTKNKSDFIEKYPTAQLRINSYLGRGSILSPDAFDGVKTFKTSELFEESSFKKYISGDSRSSGSYKVAADTYIIISSDETNCYIKVGAYVEGQWDSEFDRYVTSDIDLTYINFIPKN